MPKLLVCFPVGPKDQELALQTMQQAKRLQPKSDHPCVIIVNRGQDASALLSIATSMFAKASVFQVDPCPYGKEWPMPQNWTWQRVARRIEQAKAADAWFWWEPDCVPIKKDWLDLLWDNYKKAGKPFQGNIHTNPTNANKPYMSGIGFYPAQTSHLCQQALQVMDHPFDLVLGVVDNIMPRAAEQKLIANWVPDRADHKGYTFVDQSDLDKFDLSEAVMFHPCKDGSIYTLLNPEPKPEKRPGKKAIEPTKATRTAITVNQTDEVGVVITNFKRSEMLMAAVQSCVGALVNHITISSAAADTKVKKAHAAIKTKWPNVLIVSSTDDPGSNETWLRGVRNIDTEWVTILHDDDLLLRDFRVVEKFFQGHEFVAFDAASHGSAFGAQPPEHHHISGLLNGTNNAWWLLSNLLERGHSISPVSGCFRRIHLLSVLEEFGRYCCNDIFRTTPTMEVGNDLLIWLRACERPVKFHYLKSPIVSYGFHDQSTTCADNHEGGTRLSAIYQATKEYWASTIPLIGRFAFHQAMGNAKGPIQLVDLARTELPA